MSYFTTNPEAAKDLPGCQDIVEIVAKGCEKERMSYIDFVRLVNRVRTSQTGGMEELYRLFSKGLRFYLCRQTGPQNIIDLARAGDERVQLSRQSS